MIVSKVVGATLAIIGGSTIAWSALDYSPCSTFTVTPVVGEVKAGEQIMLHFVGRRDVGGCRVFVNYEVTDGRGIQVYEWKRDVRAPGTVGPIDSTLPIPLINGATPGEGRVSIIVSYIKNPVQAVLYKIFGWSAALPPFDVPITILPPNQPA